MSKHLLLPKAFLAISFFWLSSFGLSSAQTASIAEQWSTHTLFCISNDLARPTVHARNLFHISIAIYDSWAAYNPAAEPYLLGRTLGFYSSPFNGVAIPETAEGVEGARRSAISFAAYRLLRHRFQASPNAFVTLQYLNQQMDALGLDRFNMSTDYVNGGGAELGNYIAQQLINFGLTDGSNESGGYANLYYTPFNSNILPEQPGAGNVADPNRWQAISLTVQIDQSGNAVSLPPFLSPEWGNVLPFSMTDEHKDTFERDGNNWNVYFDPGHPSYIDTTDNSGLESLYKWNFCMVPIWQSHLDPDIDIMIDISPATLGNIPADGYPTDYSDYPSFYNFTTGGTVSPGYTMNPITGQPYEPQYVKLGDYTRILAEYWADGPGSVTPPGHWFYIYNHIRHDALFENKWMGQGEEINSLEMDVKSHLAIGGAMHDAAITAWGIKGFYDYCRPVTAVRYMCDKGQCSDENSPNYHPAGMPLVPGYIEQVLVGDPLAGPNNEHVGKIKLYTWRGPDYIPDPLTTYAGVGWILGENWWPYQRPTFVTPPFAGFISGHSTFSRTAAEVMTLITGSKYFPGGMSNFVAAQNEFLHFEVGPSETVILQWATYQDASDQCSLSRIWGGIHPPVDDIPGRLIGQELGPLAFNKANDLYNVERPLIASVFSEKTVINIDDIGTTFSATVTYDRAMNTAIPPALTFLVNNPLGPGVTVANVGWISDTEYKIDYNVVNSNIEMPNVFLRITSARDASGVLQNVHMEARPFIIDTKRPVLTDASVNAEMINDQVAVSTGLDITLTFSEACDIIFMPNISLQSASDLSNTLFYDETSSAWIDNTHFKAHYNVTDNENEIENIGVSVIDATDKAGNTMTAFSEPVIFSIDTRNPEITNTVVSNPQLNSSTVGSQSLAITFTFDEAMDTNIQPSLSYPIDNPIGTVLLLNTFATGWINATTYTVVYNQINSLVEMNDIVVSLSNFKDVAGNDPTETTFEGLFSIDTKKPEVTNVTPNATVLSDNEMVDGSVDVEISFQESMNQSQLLLVSLNGGAGGVSGSLSYNPFQSNWIDPSTFKASFLATDQNIEIPNVSISVSFGIDLAGNTQVVYSDPNWIGIDTKNPQVSVLLANTYVVDGSDIGEGGFSLLALFNEPMDQSATPTFIFDQPGTENVLTLNSSLSGWLNEFGYQAYFDVALLDEITISNIGVSIDEAIDNAGNLVVPSSFGSFFAIQINTTSVLNSDATGNFTLYPNPLPIGANLTLDVQHDLSDVRYEVWSSDGKLVFESRITNINQGKYTIPVGKLADGLYFFNLRSKEINANHKLIVVR